MSESDGLSKTDRRSGYRPELPIRVGPLYQRPVRLMAVIKWIFGFPGLLWPWVAFCFCVALVSWLYLTPDMDRMTSLSIDWIALLFARNLTFLVVFVSAWHLRLYVQKAQGTAYKYHSKWLAAGNPTFLFRNQLLDYVFWNVCSAVPIWTAYEALTLWMQANGFVPTVR